MLQLHSIILLLFRYRSQSCHVCHRFVPFFWKNCQVSLVIDNLFVCVEFVTATKKELFIFWTLCFAAVWVVDTLKFCEMKSKLPRSQNLETYSESSQFTIRFTHKNTSVFQLATVSHSPMECRHYVEFFSLFFGRSREMAAVKESTRSNETICCTISVREQARRFPSFMLIAHTIS